MKLLGKFLLVVWLGSTLSACSSTTLQHVWKDPAQSATYHKILVVFVDQHRSIRNSLEDALVGQLRKNGADAVAAYQLIPELEKMQSKEECLAVAARGGFDGVLVTRTLGKRIETYVNPGTVEIVGGWGGWGPGWWGGYRGFYGQNYQMVTTPATITTIVIYKGESNLFDVRSGRPVWAALSETSRDAKPAALIEGYAQEIVGQLVKDKLL